MPERQHDCPKGIKVTIDIIYCIILTLYDCIKPFSILVGEGDSEPFFPGLDLLLLMVCTWSSTRCCPECSLLSEGSASDVSSLHPNVIADRSGSGAIIFPSSVPFPWTDRLKTSVQSNLKSADPGGEARLDSAQRTQRTCQVCRLWLNVPGGTVVDSTLGAAPRWGGSEDSSLHRRVWREVPRRTLVY